MMMFYKTLAVGYSLLWYLGADANQQPVAGSGRLWNSGDPLANREFPLIWRDGTDSGVRVKAGQIAGSYLDVQWRRESR
jgi:hypothetical protein